MQNLFTKTFNVSYLNELTAVTRDGTLTVAGTTTSEASSVTVNSQPATRYEDDTFARAGLSLSDGNNTFEAVAQDSLGRQDSQSVTVYLPATASYSYDANGNLVSDGKRGFEYDDENQLIKVTVTNAWKSEFSYDGKLRRRIRKEYKWQSSAWVQTNEVRYVYDGNLVIQERDGNNLALVSYTRGEDLSGSLEGCRLDLRLAGAGDNGLERKGKMMTRTMRIGLLLGALALLCAVNAASAYYDPGVQRWINRDPVGELGFRILRHRYDEADELRLYVFVSNNPITIVDPLGLKIWVCTVRTSGFPLGGIGRHAYFWDDRKGTQDNDRECGREGAYGSGSSKGNQSGNSGPKPGETGHPWVANGKKGNTICYPVDGSENKEKAVMDCCRKNADKGAFVPGIQDCHTSIDDCLGSNGLTSPPHPRGDFWSNHIDDIKKASED